MALSEARANSEGGGRAVFRSACCPEMHCGLLCSSAEERCGFISFHFQVHKLSLKLKSVYAAFPGLQSKLV